MSGTIDVSGEKNACFGLGVLNHGLSKHMRFVIIIISILFHNCTRGNVYISRIDPLDSILGDSPTIVKNLAIVFRVMATTTVTTFKNLFNKRVQTCTLEKIAKKDDTPARQA